MDILQCIACSLFKASVDRGFSQGQQHSVGFTCRGSARSSAALKREQCLPLPDVRQSLGGAPDEHARHVSAILRRQLLQDLIHALVFVIIQFVGR